MERAEQLQVAVSIAVEVALAALTTHQELVSAAHLTSATTTTPSAAHHPLPQAQAEVVTLAATQVVATTQEAATVAVRADDSLVWNVYNLSKSANRL